jgi:hypothetical protein
MHQKKYSYRSGAGCRPRQGLEFTEALPRGWTSPAPPLHPGAARQEARWGPTPAAGPRRRRRSTMSTTGSSSPLRWPPAVAARGSIEGEEMEREALTGAVRIANEVVRCNNYSGSHPREGVPRSTVQSWTSGRSQPQYCDPSPLSHVPPHLLLNPNTPTSN